MDFLSSVNWAELGLKVLAAIVILVVTAILAAVVTTRMTMAARTLSPSSAQLTLDRKSTRSSDARGKGRRP